MFDNIFEAAQNQTFDIINQVMGNKARWVDAAGNVLKEAIVLFNYPDGKKDIGDIEWSLENPRIEYKEGDFTGMKEAVYNGENVFVSIYMGGVWREFQARNVKTKFDGKTVIAFISER